MIGNQKTSNLRSLSFLAKSLFSLKEKNGILFSRLFFGYFALCSKRLRAKGQVLSTIQATHINSHVLVRLAPVISDLITLHSLQLRHRNAQHCRQQTTRSPCQERQAILFASSYHRICATSYQRFCPGRLGTVQTLWSTALGLPSEAWITVC